MKVALLGDTMLGRGVAEQIEANGPHSLFADDVVDAVHDADVALANLECCISTRGAPMWKRFVFRAPPVAVDALSRLGVTAVTLANNHSLDFGPDALTDTLVHLDAAGIAHVGAGADERRARAPIVVDAAGSRLAIVALTDHPPNFAARTDRPGTAYADLRYTGLPSWVLEAITGARDDGADVVIVTPHWGPNMTQVPLHYVRACAQGMLDAGASLVAGHSAHVFHGVAPRCVYDLGDFVDDYARDPDLRNDLGLLFFVTFDGPVAVRVEALPLRLDYCFTRFATGDEREWIARRFAAACRELGTEVACVDDRLVVEWNARTN